MDLIDIGETIRDARRERGLSQADVAARSGVSRKTLIAIEGGLAPEISFKALVRVMNEVGLDLRPGRLNEGRPTLDDLLAENDGDGDAPRMGR